MIVHMSEMQQEPAVPDWTLGWRLRRALDHAGLTVEEMADELGVSRSTVSRWVHDKGPMRPLYQKVWALRCGVPADWLTGAASDPAGTSTTDQAENGTTGQYLSDTADLALAA